MYTIKFNGVPTDQLFDTRDKALKNIESVFGDLPEFKTLNMIYWPSVSARGNTCIEIVEVKK
jgi:hypothetical protein